MLGLNRALTVVCLFLSASALADDSCALSSVKLMAEGKHELLAERFNNQTAVVAQLKELTAKSGGLSGLELVNGPRFKEFRRFSVGIFEPSYTGYWVNATSERLGRVQFHVALAPQAKCELQALSLDYAD
jgi:hypothetical protein